MSRMYKHFLVTLHLRGVQNCWQYLWFFSRVHSVRGTVFLINSPTSTFFRQLNLHRIAWRNKNDWWKNISACLCMGFTAAGNVCEGKGWINIITWCCWSFCQGDKLLLFQSRGTSAKDHTISGGWWVICWQLRFHLQWQKMSTVFRNTKKSMKWIQGLETWSNLCFVFASTLTSHLLWRTSQLCF